MRFRSQGGLRRRLRSRRLPGAPCNCHARRRHITAAATKGLTLLKAGGTALDAALGAVVVLEDGCRFNAGTGANIRLDGKTVQMDAGAMDGATGRFGAVAAIADYDPICAESRARFDKLNRVLQGLEPGAGTTDAWKRFDWRRAWNFPGPIPPALAKVADGSDTVGVVARDAKGQFAAAISTGGTSITFYGRVGDVPIYGAGMYAGPHGAVACTGNGEDIVKHLVAKTVYDDLARGTDAQTAVDNALRAFPPDIQLGLIAVSASGEGGGCNWSPDKQAFDTSYRQNMAWTPLR